MTRQPSTLVVEGSVGPIEVLPIRELSDDQLLDLMVEHPDLIQRPIVERGGRAVLARPADRLREIL